MSETQAETPEQRAQRLAAAIADAETQHAHYARERLRLWSIARKDGWSFADIGRVAGLERTSIHRALDRAGMIQREDANDE